MRSWFTNIRAVASCFLLLAVGYLWSAQFIPLDFWSEAEPFNARSMPYLIGWACVVVSLLMITLPSKAFDWSSVKNLQYMPALCLLLFLTAYGFAIERLGFVGSTIGFLVAGFVVLGERRLTVMVIVAVAVAGGFWILMDLLGIYLNPGEWFL